MKRSLTSFFISTVLCCTFWGFSAMAQSQEPPKWVGKKIEVDPTIVEKTQPILNPHCDDFSNWPDRDPKKHSITFHWDKGVQCLGAKNYEAAERHFLRDMSHRTKLVALSYSQLFSLYTRVLNLTDQEKCQKFGNIAKLRGGLPITGGLKKEDKAELKAELKNSGCENIRIKIW